VFGVRFPDPVPPVPQPEPQDGSSAANPAYGCAIRPPSESAERRRPGASRGPVLGVDAMLRHCQARGSKALGYGGQSSVLSRLSSELGPGLRRAPSNLNRCSGRSKSNLADFSQIDAALRLPQIMLVLHGVIILVRQKGCVALLECKCEPPVAIDPNRPATLISSLDGVESEAWNTQQGAGTPGTTDLATRHSRTERTG